MKDLSADAVVSRMVLAEARVRELERKEADALARELELAAAHDEQQKRIAKMEEALREIALTGLTTPAELDVIARGYFYEKQLKACIRTAARAARVPKVPR